MQRLCLRAQKMRGQAGTKSAKQRFGEQPRCFMCLRWHDPVKSAQLTLLRWFGVSALCATLLCLVTLSTAACELCAIYRATNARGESSSGFLLTLSEQFVHYGTLQHEGEPYHKN